MTTKNIVMAAAGASSGPATYIEDVFSTYLYTGNGTSQFIENGINLGSSNSGGSAYFDGSGDSLVTPTSANLTIGTGAFQIDFWMYSLAVPSQFVGPFGTNNAGIFFAYRNGNLDFVNNVDTVGVISAPYPAINQWHHIALVRNSSNVRSYYINGTRVGTLSNSADFNQTQITVGNTSWNGYVSNFRVIVGSNIDDPNSSTITVPTAPTTAVSGTQLLLCQTPTPFVDKSTNAFAITINGNATAKSFGPFTSATAGKGGLVWIKGRNNGWNNILQDTSRGINSSLCTNNTDGAIDPAGVYLTSFDSNGFSINTNGSVNFNGNTYASWAFREQAKFFDIVTYTGDGSVPRNIAHNLGSAPGCIIVKSTSQNTNWAVYHRSLGATQLIRLNRDWASESSYQNWANTSPTSTQFTVGADGSVNASGQTYVAYLFAHDAGGFGLTGSDNVISCGSFTTDGSGNATVELGFEPQWLLTKQSNSGNSWGIYDTMRGWSYSNQKYLLPDMSIAEGGITATQFVPNATGFKTSSPFATSAPYIYIAIRRPMKVPTDATKVFNTALGVSTAPAYRSSNFNVGIDAAIEFYTPGYSGYPRWNSRLTGAVVLPTSATDAEAATSHITWDYMNGYVNIAGLGTSHGSWMFKRAPGFFDEVCYRGTGSALSLAHNLGVAPELIITKSRSQGSGYNWHTWYNGLTNNQYLNLNSDSAIQTYSGIFGGSSTVATATTFNVSNSPTANNDSGQNFVAYLFATCPGVSKVGQFTNSGSTINVDCGFTNGARFVLLKRTNSTGGWFVYDTVRGINAGNDPGIALNSAGPEFNVSDDLDSYGPGFAFNGASWVQANYLFLAIA